MELSIYSWNVKAIGSFFDQLAPSCHVHGLKPFFITASHSINTMQ